MNRNTAFLFIALLGPCCARAAPARSARLSFGVTADVQYADQDSALGRDYRGSLAKLKHCVAAWNRLPLDFVVQLGDIVDGGGLESFDAVLSIFAGLRTPLYHVAGNHDFTAGRAVLFDRLGLRRAYYDFRRGGWRFVVLDGMNESAATAWPESDPHARAGRLRLDELTREMAPNAQPWNGAAGRDQLAWLRRVLASAERDKERVIVFSHFPALAESCRPNHLLWDHAELVRILQASPAVAAYFNGHDHQGGFGESAGIPFVTFPGLVERPPEDACSVVELQEHAITIRSISGAVLRTIRAKTAR